MCKNHLFLPRLARVFGLLAVLSISCTTAVKDWQKTTDLDTIEAYETFVSRWRSSEFADSARSRLSELEWDRLQGEDYLPAFISFEQEHLTTVYADSAVNHIEAVLRTRGRRLSWQESEIIHSSIIEPMRAREVSEVEAASMSLKEIYKDTGSLEVDATDFYYRRKGEFLFFRRARIVSPDGKVDAFGACCFFRGVLYELNTDPD